MEEVQKLMNKESEDETKPFIYKYQASEKLLTLLASPHLSRGKDSFVIKAA